MPRHSTNTLLSDADRIIDTWTANPDFKLGTVTLDQLKTERADLATADLAVETMRTDLTGLMNARDDKAKVLFDIVTRARSGFRAVYGPDSSQYEQAGGTRSSERATGLHRGAQPKPHPDA